MAHHALVEVSEGRELLLVHQVELGDEQKEVPVRRVDVRWGGWQLSSKSAPVQHLLRPRLHRQDTADSPSMLSAQSCAKWWLYKCA